MPHFELPKSKDPNKMVYLKKNCRKKDILSLGVYACGFKSSHRNRRGPIGYDRHLANSDNFGSHGSLNLGQGTFRAPVEGVYLVNFESHFDCGKGPTNKETAYRIVIR